MTRALWMVVAAVAVGAGVPAGAGPTKQTPGERVAALEAAKKTFDDALARSQTQVPSGEIYAAELSLRATGPVYVVRMITGDLTHAVTVDAVSGEPTKQEDGPYHTGAQVIRARLAASRGVGLVPAIEAAQAPFDGFRAFSTELVVKGSEVFYEVWMVKGEEVKVVLLTLAGEVRQAGAPVQKSGK